MAGPSTERGKGSFEPRGQKRNKNAQTKRNTSTERSKGIMKSAISNGLLSCTEPKEKQGIVLERDAKGTLANLYRSSRCGRTVHSKKDDFSRQNKLQQAKPTEDPAGPTFVSGSNLWQRVHPLQCVQIPPQASDGRALAKAVPCITCLMTV